MSAARVCPSEHDGRTSRNARKSLIGAAIAATVGASIPQGLLPRKKMGFLIVFLGSGMGGALRHGVNLMAVRLFGHGFPLGTFIVNVTGSLLMGMLAGYFAHRAGISQEWRLLLTTGFLGGFTTFSAFSLDAALLYERGSYGALAAYLAGSVLLALLAFLAGMSLFRGNPL